MATTQTDKRFRHGQAHTKIYDVWNSMRLRCTKPSQSCYPNYGGRGIKVCERWMNSFENFFADMGSTYQEGLSLDRIDVDGDYTPENCRWSTWEEQMRNTRKNKLFTINGATKNLSAWIEETEVKSSTVRQRYYAYGWDIEKALFTPTGGTRRVVS